MKFKRKERLTIKQIGSCYCDYYYLTEEGRVYNSKTERYLEEHKDHRYRLMTTDNKIKSVSLKELYRITYNKEFCIDTIQDIKGEIWREIADTDQKYFASSEGRIKSCCRYEARIMKPTINNKGYEKLQIVIKGFAFNKFVHTLIADTFPEECGRPQGNDWQVHHKNGIKRDNRSKNLVYVSELQHLEIHK